MFCHLKISEYGWDHLYIGHIKKFYQKILIMVIEAHKNINSNPHGLWFSAAEKFRTLSFVAKSEN